MDQVDEEIKWKCCPLCKTPVLKTSRCANITKGIVRDMNEVKQRKLRFLSTSERAEFQAKLLKIPLHDMIGHGFVRVPRTDAEIEWQELVRGFSDFGLQKAYTLLLSACDVMRARKSLQEICSSNPTLKELTSLLSQADDFLQWIKDHKHVDMLTDQMTVDVTAERRRILLLEAMLKTMCALNV